MKFPDRTPLFIWAFLGGSALSWLNLMTSPEAFNRFVAVGILSAGIVGIIGHTLFDNGRATKKSSFATGVAAPNLIGGLINASSNVTVAFSLGFMSVYADSTAVVIPPNTATIEIVVEGTDRDVKVKNMETGKVYTIDDNNSQKIPYANKFEIQIDGIGTKDIESGDHYTVDSTNAGKLKIISIKKHKTSGFLRGFIPFQQNAGNIQHKIEVVEIEPEPEVEDRCPAAEEVAVEEANEQ